MTKSELIKKLESKSVRYAKSWTKAKLEKTLSENSHRIGVNTFRMSVNPSGNWNVAKDWFPDITIDQSTRDAVIITYDSYGYQKKASVDTEWIKTDLSDNGDSLFVRGEVSCRNFIHGKCSGSQRFCFAIFVGDSGHIYTHRAPASKGWMDAKPETIRKRLRKLGIGAVENIVQQGDFLLKPANGNAYADDEFRHESMGAGHHNFAAPVLYADGEHGRQYKITEEITLIHKAVDGIQHPTVTVPPGVWVVGTTATSLAHPNARD